MGAALSFEMKSGTVADMTHDEIAEWGAVRVSRMGYPFAFANMTSATAGEQPDVLGMDAYAGSILVEVKVSRSDFLADKKKPWRKPGQGMGQRRAYLTPKGLLSPDEVPYGWELWEVHGKTKPQLKIVKGQAEEAVKTDWGVRRQPVLRHCDLEEFRHFAQDYSGFRKEAMWALKILGRLRDAGYPIEKFANAAELKRMGVIKIGEVA